MTVPGITFVSEGTITSPQGFCAGATRAGIKKADKNSLDLGILYSEEPCITAGVFTTSRIKAAPVVLCQERLKKGKIVALVVNSGRANAYTGEPGLADAREMTALVAKSIGAEPEEILVASTGVTGQRLPMEKIRTGIDQVILSSDGGHELARAIMTTDTVPKEVAVAIKGDGNEYTIGGIAKGSGMIHPNLATMFCFLTTDARVEPGFLRSALQQVVDVSFNMISVDGDTSPSDTVLVMANGRAENETISQNSQQAGIFQQALEQVCIHLAKAIARDGEGATKLIEVTVSGACNLAEARLAARAVVSSPLVKTAVHGADPNWGRIIAAVARSGAEVEETKIGLDIGGINMVREGMVQPFSEPDVVQLLKQKEISIRVDLNLGTASATAWGCDLSQEYVTINSQYMT